MLSFFASRTVHIYSTGLAFLVNTKLYIYLLDSVALEYIVESLDEGWVLVVGSGTKEADVMLGMWRPQVR